MLRAIRLGDKRALRHVSHKAELLPLTESDLRVGQTLRISRSWVKAQESKKPPRFETCRWYFLTEDNHWAPMSDSDAVTLEQAMECARGDIQFLVQ